MGVSILAVGLIGDDESVQLLVGLHAKQLVLLALRELEEFLDLLLLLHLRLLLLLLQLLFLEFFVFELFDCVFLFLKPFGILLVDLAALATAKWLAGLFWVKIRIITFAFDRDHEHCGFAIGR
jgi:hypothetical protein